MKMLENLAKNVYRRRTELGMTMEDLSRKLGYKSKVSIFKIEHGQADVPHSKVIEIAAALDTTVSELLGIQQDQDDDRTIPVLGRVAAGPPIYADEDIIQYIKIDSSLIGEYFGLKIKGHSMEPRIHDGDIVIVKQQSTVDSGQLAIVLIDNEATCKKVLRNESGLWLISFNPNYEPIHVDENITILGRVVELRAEL